MNLVYVGNTLINDVMLGAKRMDDVLQNYRISPVTSGSVLLLDAANRTSYSGSGTNWFDLSGNSNNAKLQNVNNVWTSSLGGYFDFPANTLYSASVTHSTSLAVFGTGSEFTVEYWMTIDDNLGGGSDNFGVIEKSSFADGSGWGTLWGRNYPTDPNNYGVGGMWLLGSPNNNTTGSRIMNPWVTGSWLCVQHIRSGSVLKTYSNLNQLSAVTASVNANNTTAINIGLGIAGDSPVYPMGGKLMFTAIYNRALTPAEQTQNYNSMASRVGLALNQ
jgi:hypothetical protein